MDVRYDLWRVRYPHSRLYPPLKLRFSTSLTLIFSIFVWPFVLEVIGWKTYMINGSWNVLQFLFIWYSWIEPRGLSLEQIEAKIDAAVGAKGRLEVLDGQECREEDEGKAGKGEKGEVVSTAKQWEDA